MIRVLIICFTVKTVVDRKFMDDDKTRGKKTVGGYAKIQMRSHVSPVAVIMKMERKLSL